MIINRTNLVNMNTGYQTAFRNAFDSVALSYTDVATVVPSSTAIETYEWLVQMTGMREWIGERFKKNLETEAYILKNRKFEDTVSVPREKIEDDTHGSYTPAIGMMAQSAAEHPEELIFREALPLGFEKACFDGQNFFDAEHPVKNGDGNEVSVSNFQAGASTPWFMLCTNRPVKPLIYQDRIKPELIINDDPQKSQAVFDRDVFEYGTRSRGAAGYAFWQMAAASKAELTADNFKSMRTGMMSLKGDGGRPLNVTPNLLVIPPSLESQADEILKMTKLDNGKTNVNQGKMEILVSNWLS